MQFFYGLPLLRQSQAVRELSLEVFWYPCGVLVRVQLVEGVVEQAYVLVGAIWSVRDAHVRVILYEEPVPLPLVELSYEHHGISNYGEGPCFVAGKAVLDELVLVVDGVEDLYEVS